MQCLAFTLSADAQLGRCAPKRGKTRQKRPLFGYRLITRFYRPRLACCHARQGARSAAAGQRVTLPPRCRSRSRSIHVGEVWLPKCQFDLLAVDPRGRGLGVRRVGQFDLPLTLVDPRGRGLGARQCLQRPRYGLRADRAALGRRHRQKRQRITASATAETIMPVMHAKSGMAGGSSGAKVMAVT